MCWLPSKCCWQQRCRTFCCCLHPCCTSAITPRLSARTIPFNLRCCFLCGWLQAAFDSDAVLGPLDENDPDMAGDDDDEAEQLEGEEEDGLSAALAAASL